MKKIYILGIVFLSTTCLGMQLERKTDQLNKFIAQQIKLFSNNDVIHQTLTIINNIGGDFPAHLIALFHVNNEKTIKKKYIEIYKIPKKDHKLVNEYYKHLQNTFKCWIYNLPEIREKKELTHAIRKLNEFPNYLADCF